MSPEPMNTDLESPVAVRKQLGQGPVHGFRVRPGGPPRNDKGNFKSVAEKRRVTRVSKEVLTLPRLRQ